MKKTYIQPNVEAIEMTIKQPVLIAMSGDSSEFGKGGSQRDGDYTVNGRGFDFDDEE
ncbi:MAG: hypothetical protein IJ155_07985 [Prevotella sp.]|nr:hypothetical protein [Prevotella sp.]